MTDLVNTDLFLSPISSPSCLFHPPPPSTPRPLSHFCPFYCLIPYRLFLQILLADKQGRPCRHLGRMLTRPCLPAIQALNVNLGCCLVSHLPAASFSLFSSLFTSSPPYLPTPLPSASSALPSASSLPYSLLPPSSFIHPSSSNLPFFFLPPPSFLPLLSLILTSSPPLVVEIDS